MLMPVTGESARERMLLDGLIGAVLPVRSRGAVIAQSGFAAPTEPFFSFGWLASSASLRSLAGFTFVGEVVEAAACPCARSLVLASFCLSWLSRARTRCSI